MKRRDQVSSMDSCGDAGVCWAGTPTFLSPERLLLARSRSRSRGCSMSYEGGCIDCSYGGGSGSSALFKSVCC